MKEKLQNKLVLPLAALAIVGAVGATYTLTHSGPTTAQAQTPTVKSATQGIQDKETQDDVVNAKPSVAVQQKADTNENDTTDNSTTPEVEDGN